MPATTPPPPPPPPPPLPLPSGNTAATPSISPATTTPATPLNNYTSTLLLGPLKHSISFCQVSADRRRAVLRSDQDDECVLRIYDVASQTCVGALVALGPPVCSIAISASRRFVATGGENGLVRAWDLSALPEPPALEPGFPFAHTPLPPPLGDYHKLEAVPQVLVEQAHSAAVNFACFSPTCDSRLLTASEDRTARLYEGSPLRCTLVLTGHSDAVTAAAFHPTRTDVFATASLDLTVLVSRKPGEVLHTLLGFKAAIFGLAFSPSGDMLATSCVNRALDLWAVPCLPEPTPATHLATLDNPSLCRNQLVQWSQPLGEFIMVAANDGVAIWGDLLTKPTQLALLRAPRDVAVQNLLHNARFTASGVALVYASRRHAKSQLDLGCFLVEHRLVPPVVDSRIEFGIAVGLLFRRYSGGYLDLPTGCRASHSPPTVVGLVLHFLLG